MSRTFSIGMVLSALALLAACSSSSSSNDTSDAAVVDASPEALGEKLVTQYDCKSCHGTNLAGTPTTIPHYTARTAPNLTSDSDTGIGGWSDDQVKQAIKTGVDDEGASLCWVMPRFGFLSDGDLSNIVTYLRSVPAVKQDIPDSDCPSDGGTAPADAAAE